MFNVLLEYSFKPIEIIDQRNAFCRQRILKSRFVQKKTADREIFITFRQWELKKPQVFEQQSYIPVSVPASEQLRLNRWKLTVVVTNVDAYPFCGSHIPDLSLSWYRNRCFLVGLSRLIIQDTELGSSNQEVFSSTIKKYQGSFRAISGYSISWYSSCFPWCGISGLVNLSCIKFSIYFVWGNLENSVDSSNTAIFL